MNGIQIMVYCPDCQAEVEMILKRLDILPQLFNMMKMLKLPTAGRENAYKGEKKCSCGKIVKATFVIEAFNEGERPQAEFIISGGF